MTHTATAGKGGGGEAGDASWATARGGQALRDEQNPSQLGEARRQRRAAAGQAATVGQEREIGGEKRIRLACKERSEKIGEDERIKDKEKGK